MKNKDKIKIGSGKMLILYIIICSIFGTILTVIATTSNKLLTISCITSSIVTVFCTAIYWIIVKKSFTIDKLTIKSFIKNTVILLTLLAIGSIVVNVYKGYNNIYTNLYTLRVACDIIEKEYKEDPEHFVGYGFAEGCNNWNDIKEAEKNTLNGWIESYFITPIVPTCIKLLVSIVTLELFSHISVDRIKLLTGFILGKNN